MSKLRVLSPVGALQVTESGLAARGRDLRGLRIGIINNGKPNSDAILDQAAKLLEERFGLTRTVERRKANTSLAADFLDEFAEQCDVALTGVGE